MIKNFVLIIFFALTAQSALSFELAVGCAGNQLHFDKNVFNWRYYLQNNSDLLEGGYKTPEQACNHWDLHGMNEGRQAHAGFHSKQYLSRYPDLSQYYGAGNYSAAISHYVNNGISEWRIGHHDNGISNGGKTTTISNVVGNTKIFVGVSTRMAGAVDSLIYDNIEFINSYDHGRELQIALVSNWNGEDGSYNPTEAGSCQNWFFEQSSSILNNIYALGSKMSTSITPAFWFEPNPVVNNVVSCPGIGKGPGIGKVAHNYLFKKDINIGELSGLPNVIEYKSHIDINENVPQNPSFGKRVRFEVPTGYLAGEFYKKYSFNKNNSTLTNITSLPCHFSYACTSDDPLIFTNESESHAMGICSGSESGAIFNNHPKYESWGTWFSDSPINYTTKFAVLKYIDADVYSGTKVSFNTYLIMGKMDGGISAINKVKNTLSTLHQRGLCI